MVGSIQFLISYLVLFAVAGFCLYNSYMELGYEKPIALEFPYLTYGFPTIYGLFGLIIHFSDTMSYTWWRWLYNTEVFVKTLSYPCFVTQTWLKYGVIQPDIAWVHALSGAVPTVLFLYKNRLKRSWVDIIVYLSTVSLLAVCIQTPNYWGLGSATVFPLGYYIQRNRMSYLNIEPDVSFNVATAVFCYCTTMALTSA